MANPGTVISSSVWNTQSGTRLNKNNYLARPQITNAQKMYCY